MPGYRFTENAEADLADILAFTVRSWGQEQAHAYLDGLEKQVAAVAVNPGIGRPCDHLAPGLQAFPYVSHTLYYLTDKADIIIVRVLHQSMNPTLQFSSGWPSA